MRISLILVIAMLSSCAITEKKSNRQISTGHTAVLLDKMVFGDGVIFLNTESLATSLKYHFAENTYFIELTDGYDDKYPKYIIEKGRYTIVDMQISLVPLYKLFCELGFGNQVYLCKNSGVFSGGELMNSKSLPHELPYDSLWDERLVNLGKKNDTLSFRDSEYTFFEFTAIIKGNN